jgi:dTDP-4-dehydrorhamnose 3,5-epimerase
MVVKETGIQGLVEILPKILQDDRGWFLESYKQEVFSQHGIPTNFPQENTSFSKKGVIRGMHFQVPPFAQGKLVKVIQGRVLDVTVDLRTGSASFGKVYYYELDEQRQNMLMVPEGFAHGFAALEDTYFEYKCTNVYSKAHESGIVWNDADLKIEWPFKNGIVSEKDQQLPTFQQLLRNSVISP